VLDEHDSATTERGAAGPASRQQSPQMQKQNGQIGTPDPTKIGRRPRMLANLESPRTGDFQLVSRDTQGDLKGNRRTPSRSAKSATCDVQCLGPRRFNLQTVLHNGDAPRRNGSVRQTTLLNIRIAGRRLIFVHASGTSHGPHIRTSVSSQASIVTKIALDTNRRQRA